MTTNRTELKDRLNLSQNDYLKDRLTAQRLLSFMSFIIPLGLFCIYLIAPQASDSGSHFLLIGISTIVILFSTLRLLRNWNVPKGNSYQLYYAFLDFLSIAAILIGYAFSYDIPIASTLKSPTASILFIYLTSRIILFNGKVMIQTGIIAIGTWVGLTLLSLYEPNSLGRTSSYIEYLAGFKILIGAEIERIFQFVIITGMLYSFIYFARHDSQTGFLQRTYFHQSLLKFLNQGDKKFGDRKYALIEIRASDVAHSNNQYAPIFKSLPNIKAFQDIPFKKFGRLTSIGVLAWVDFNGDSRDLQTYIKQIHKELSELAVLKLRSKAPNFVIGATFLDFNLKGDSQLSRHCVATKEALAIGKKTMVFDQTLEAKILKKQSVEQAIKQGLDENLFYVAYQPIIDLMTKRPVGLEALIRLNTKTGTPIGPDVFIPIAEESGLIDDITEFLCETIAHEAIDIRKMFSGSGMDPYININISPIQLKDMNRTISALRRASSGGLKINAEITESTILNDDEADNQINALIAAGFEIAIDDFGTGYSSIQRLKKMNNMVLKIDQSFVQDIENPEAYSFLGAIVNLAQVSSSSVIIEGVENLQQQLLLMNLGVRFCQGFFFAKPMTVSALRDYLAEEFDFAPAKLRRAVRLATF